jgi:hypothetical protein
VVNAGFGVAVGLGLLALGLPYPALWGFLAGILRFVPAVGIWLVAPFPAALSFIRSPNPAQALAILALFLVLELLTAYLIEPRVCGRSVGLAPVPLLLAVMFWTGLWGIVGLVLATPLTVCLAVLGKHVGQLELLAVLLGSRPALSPEARYFQRLLARDRFEAEAVVREHLAEHTLEDLCDGLVVQALVLVRRNRHNGELRPEDEQFILQTTGELLEGLGQNPSLALRACEDPSPAQRAGEVSSLALRACSPSAMLRASEENSNGQVLVLPACDAVDETAVRMLRCLARAADRDVLLPGEAMPLSGLVSVMQKHPAAVIIVSVAPEGLTQARYLCRRLRGQSPELKIVVARLGQRREVRKRSKLLLSAGANRVVTTLQEACGLLEQLTETPSSPPDAGTTSI